MNKPVRIFLLMISFALLGSSCKKLVEDKKRDLLVQAMTDGTWHIETFQEGAVTITDQFTGYNFQFHANGTVIGFRDTRDEEGTWSGDLQNYSIMSNFPSAENPLKKLNGTWKITDSAADLVVAEMSTSQAKNILHLRKNE
jgi:hypothetical protein